MATTGICDSFKAEAMQGVHSLNASQTQTFTLHTNTTADTGTSTANICRGMAVSGTNVAALSRVADVTNATAFVLSIAATGGSAQSLTFTADALKIALVKVAPTTTFNHTQTNIGTPGSSASSTSNLGTDEVAASGNYASGGQALTNVSPVVVSGTAVGTFSNVSWTTATISTTAGIIYNNDTRGGAAATPINGRTVSVHDFGGTQTVTSGTLTLVMPTADQNNGLLRIA